MVPDWLRLSIGAAASMFVGMGLGRFSYGPMVPALVESGALDAAEAGYVGAGNLLGFLAGALLALPLARLVGEAAALRRAVAFAVLCLAASAAPWGFAWLVFWRFLVGAAAAVTMIHCLAVGSGPINWGCGGMDGVIQRPREIGGCDGRPPFLAFGRAVRAPQAVVAHQDPRGEAGR